MHTTTRLEIALFRETYSPAKVADLGSYNINGAVKDIMPQAVGFDIMPGPGVDVVIPTRPMGVELPAAHFNAYDAVVCASSFQHCSDADRFAAEVKALISCGGLLFVSACGPRCKATHTTSPNHRWPGDYHRLSAIEMEYFWQARGFTCERMAQYAGGHNDVIYWGRFDG